MAATTRSQKSKPMATLDIDSMSQLLKSELKSSIHEVMEEIKTLGNKFDYLKSSLNKVTETANKAHENASEAKVVVNAVDSRVSNLERALEVSLTEQAKLHEKTLYLESYSRRLNLKFEGIAEKKSEDCTQIICDTLDKMDLDSDNIDISRVHRIGSFNHKSKTQRPRQLIVQFVNFGGRESVWNKRSTLAGSNIWIKEDYPRDIEERRKILWPYARAARMGDPRNPKGRISVSLKMDKLMINNQAFTTENIDNVPEYVKSRVENPPSTIKMNDVTIFFTKSSPFSNFHRCEFEIDDVKFSSVEQYLCHKKALMFDSAEAAQEVLEIDDPKSQKDRVKQLANFDEHRWSSEAGSVLKPALLAKFSQNHLLGDVLLDTDDTVMGEAS